MKLFTCCSFLLFATMVVTAPIRARRENVLSFLNDALGTTTEKTTLATTTATLQKPTRNPPNKQVKEQDSEDVSEENSTESFDTNGFKDAFKDPDSHEVTIPKVVDKDKAPSRRKGVAYKDSTRLIDMSSRLVQDQGSREHSGPHGAQQAGRQPTDLNSEEGRTVENLSGKQVIHLSGEQVTDSARLGTNLQRKATPGRGNGLNGMLTPGRNTELQDLDSLEDNNGQPALVGNRGDADYDDTKEFISAETYPIGALAPEHIPSGLFVPAKSRSS